MKILGIDYGDARTGLAVSDITRTIASPLETFQSKSMRKDIDYVAETAKKHQVSLIVLGLPKNMDGSEGERANKTRAFGKNLSKVTGLDVDYKDERLTSVSAERFLIEGNMRREKRKEVIDTMAAQIILQSYLDALKFKNERLLNNNIKED